MTRGVDHNREGSLYNLLDEAVKRSKRGGVVWNVFERKRAAIKRSFVPTIDLQEAIQIFASIL
ncbi:hypothetical protein ACTHRH_11925 [Paenibacillus sp. SAFN-117]